MACDSLGMWSCVLLRSMFVSWYVGIHQLGIILLSLNLVQKSFIQTGDAFSHGARQNKKGSTLSKSWVLPCIPECTLMSKLSPNDLKDVFWMTLSEYQR